MNYFKSSRLALRAVEPEDLELYYQIENDTELWRNSVTTAPFSRYALRRFLEQASCDVYADGRVPLVITLHDGTPIGLIDMYDYSVAHQRAEVGIVVRTPWQRQGYALEALQLLSRYAACHLHLHQLYAIVAADNVPAARLFSKAGFRVSGRLADWLCRDVAEYVDASIFTLFLRQSFS